MQLAGHLEVLLHRADVQTDHHDRNHQGSDPADPKAAG
jgi:hypothetical protein